MLEKKEILVKNQVSGVALVIQNFKGQILTLIEKESKKWKIKGQLSIPMETREKVDKNWQEVIRRCLIEEIGLSKEDIDKVLPYLIDKGDMFYLVKDQNNFEFVRMRIFGYRGAFFDNINFSNKEVENVKMTDIDYLISKFLEDSNSVRPGVIESILKAITGEYRPSNILVIENGQYRQESLNSLTNSLKELGSTGTYLLKYEVHG